MTLSAAAIAFDGIGFGAEQMAFDGLRPIDIAAPTVFGGSGYKMPKRKRRPINDEEELMAIIQMALHVMGRRP